MYEVNEMEEDLKATTSVQPWVDDMNHWIVSTLKSGFDVFFQGRDYARFYALEKVARSPYMSYVSVLVREAHAIIYDFPVFVYFDAHVRGPLGLTSLHTTALYGNAWVIQACRIYAPSFCRV